MSEEKKSTFTIEKEIVRSGFSIDGRYMSRSVVKAMYNNTKREMLEKGLLIPLKLGHEDPDQRLKGRVIDIKLKRKLKPKLKTYELSIFAKIEMSADAYRMYKNNELPNLSIEAPPFGVDEDGKEFGEYISALALLGTDPPAFPWLMHQHKDMAFCYSLLPKFKKEQKIMDPKEILAKLEEAALLIADLQSLVGAGDGGEEAADEPEKEEDEKAADFDSGTEDSKPDAPEPKQDADTPPEQDRIKELEQQVKDLQAEKSFADLHAAGKIASDQKPQFKALVKETDISFAIGHYSQSKTKSPPQDSQTKSTNNPTPANVEKLTKYWNGIYTKKFNMKGDSLKRYTEMAVQKQLAKESKNGSN